MVTIDVITFSPTGGTQRVASFLTSGGAATPKHPQLYL